MGRPKQNAYKASALSLHETLVAEGATTGLTERAAPHNRGHFPAINVGAMHGNGTVNPNNLSAKGQEATVARLLKNPHVRKLAAFASCKFNLRVSTVQAAERWLCFTDVMDAHDCFFKNLDIASAFDLLSG